MLLHRVIVMGSRDFEDVEFLREQMLKCYYNAVWQHPEEMRVQFIFPSEVGRDRIERPVRGVARTGFSILHAARQRGVKNPNMLLPILATIDWDVVKTVETTNRTGEFVEERRIPANFLWNTDVLDDGTWAEFIMSEGGNVDSAFTAVANEVIVVEHDGSDAWCRDMMRKAQAAGLGVNHFQTRSRIPGMTR